MNQMNLNLVVLHNLINISRISIYIISLDVMWRPVFNQSVS